MIILHTISSSIIIDILFIERAERREKLSTHANGGGWSVRKFQDRSLHEGKLELFESGLVLWLPLELGILPSESGNRDYCVREIDDKMSVEICKSKKGLDLFQVQRDRPIANSLCFRNIHRNASGGDHKSKEFDRMSMKEGFLGFDVQAVLQKS